MKPLRIGITGGIGSGKSLVCKIFASLGVPTYDADTRAKKLMIEEEVVVNQIKKESGEQSNHEDGSLKRDHLRKQEFNDPFKLEPLTNWFDAGCPLVRE